MQAEDVRTLRQSAVPTAVIGVLSAVLAGVLSGEKGVLGAVLALAVVTAFFMISTVVLNRAAKVSPQAMMIAALSSFFVKIVLLAVLTARFRDTTAFNGRAFGLTAIVCVLAWCATQVRVMVKSKILYVDPAAVPLNHREL
jgi:ATP synthase protein I